MDRHLVIIVLIFAVTRAAYALTCYECGEGSCSASTTCQSGSYQCQTVKTTMSGFGEFLAYSCATDDCVSITNNVTSALIVSQCCSSNLCNDGSVPPLEGNLAYCYSATCSSKGCLSGLISYIDSNNLGTFCPASEEGCQTTITETIDTSSGQVTVLESTGCATDRCNPVYQSADGLNLRMNCCKDRLCNNGGEMTVDPSKDYCYAYTCTSATNCLSVADAAAEGKMAFCEKPPEGCFFSSTSSEDTDSSMFNVVAGCVGQSPQFLTCTPSHTEVGGLSITMKCCNRDKCNDGSDEIVDPNKSYCYVYTCVDDTCLSMSDAIGQGQTSLCVQTNQGCFYSRMVTSNGTIATSGCVGVTPGAIMCVEASGTYGDTQTTMKCCSTDRCNNGSSSGGDDSGEDEKEYCHMYLCIPTPGTTCMSLPEAVGKGRTTRCEQGDKGCYAMGNSTHVSAGCVGAVYGVLECPPTAVCCKSDGCNNKVTSASGPLMCSYILLFLSVFLLCTRI